MKKNYKRQNILKCKINKISNIFIKKVIIKNKIYKNYGKFLNQKNFKFFLTEFLKFSLNKQFLKIFQKKANFL